MSGSFSLVEKLAVAGAFCALVAMAVGTETDPGVVAETKLKPGQTVASATAVQGKAKANYWSLPADGSVATAGDARPAPPPPEILPPEFGATPSPDLPQ